MGGWLPSKVGSMLDQRRRRWANIEPTLGEVSCLLAGQFAQLLAFRIMVVVIFIPRENIHIYITMSRLIAKVWQAMQFFKFVYDHSHFQRDSRIPNIYQDDTCSTAQMELLLYDSSTVCWLIHEKAAWFLWVMANWRRRDLNISMTCTVPFYQRMTVYCSTAFLIASPALAEWLSFS